MAVNQSLKAQMLLLIGSSLLAILLIALGCFHFLSNNVRDYRELIDGPLRTSQLIDEANLQFKIQVQEWKNVLLRGKAPADRDKYWGQFEERYREVQHILGQLVEQPGIAPSLQQQVAQLRDAHKTLQADYTKGRDAFVAAGMNRQIATAAEEQTSVAEDISRNLTQITVIASTNQASVERTEQASSRLHELSAQLNAVTARLAG